MNLMKVKNYNVRISALVEGADDQTDLELV